MLYVLLTCNSLSPPRQPLNTRKPENLNDILLKRMSEEYLTPIAIDNKNGYAEGFPFPHIIIDHLFPDKFLSKLNMEQLNNSYFSNRCLDGEKCSPEKETSEETIYGSYTKNLLHYLQTPLFLNFLEHLTGIHGLMTDPFELSGVHKLTAGKLCNLMGYGI